MTPRLASATSLLLAAMAAAVGGCGGQSSAAAGPGRQAHVRGHGDPAAKPTSVRRTSNAPVITEPRHPGSGWQLVASVHGQPAAWIARRSGVTLLRFEQRLVHLALHAGLGEPRGSGWRYGDKIEASEIHRVLAAFNGGFRLTYGKVGFLAYGRVAVPLGPGLGSIVTYRNGMTEIGAWTMGVPARGMRIASVLQNQRLLVNRGVAAPTVSSCVIVCWGKTVGGSPETARTALGITGEGRLVWAAGESLTPAALARTLIGAGAVRAVELDINPGWVAGFLYRHHRGGPTAIPVVPGQDAIPNKLLAPYNRDFFTVLAN